MTIVCQVYLAVLSAYHVFTGVISFAFGGFALRFYKSFYGADPIERRHLWLILKPWGALSICAGIAGLSAVPDPRAHRGVVVALLVLLLLRVVYRIRWRADLRQISGIAPARNRTNVALLAAGIVILGAWLVLEASR